MPKTLFICRGSVEVGLGHIMRTRSVAEEMRALADVHVVVIGDPGIAGSLMGTDVPYTCVAQDVDVLAVARQFGAEVAVFDLLDIDENLFREIQPTCRTVCISPVFRFLPEVDLAFTRAASPVHRKLSRATRGAAVRIGCQYATIGSHCRPVPTSVYEQNLSDRPLSIAISMGGADAANKTLQVLDAVRRSPVPFLIHVMVGEGYMHSYQQLMDCLEWGDIGPSDPPQPPLATASLGLVKGGSQVSTALARGGSGGARHGIVLARAANSMWRVLSNCSLAVLAGGITTYEAAHAGIPCLITLDRPEQKYLIQELVAAGAALYAGAPLAAALTSLNDSLVYLDEHRDVLLSMHRRGKALVDPYGARRMAEEIVHFDPAADRVPEVLCA